MSDKVVNSDFEKKLFMFHFALWSCIYRRIYRKEARLRVFGVKRAFCDVKTGASALKMQQNAALSSKMGYGKNQTRALCARTRIWPEARLPSRKTFFDKNSLCCCIFNAEAHCFDLAERSLDTGNPKMSFFPIDSSINTGPRSKMKHEKLFLEIGVDYFVRHFE